MALTLLRQLLDSAKSRNVDIGTDQKTRIVQTSAKYLDDADAEVRKADVELASEMFELFGSSKAEFWSEFKGTDEGRLGLLTYYIARRGKGRA
jgi:CLIP-associating protein 1/2